MFTFLIHFEIILCMVIDKVIESTGEEPTHLGSLDSVKEEV